jgi:hypothetical protein
MYNNNEKIYQCSFCQTVLSGRVKASREEKSYISITGTISLQLWDADAEYRSFLYISSKPKEDGKPVQMYFCNFKCLEEYAKWKHKDYNDARREKLLEEANEMATRPRRTY